MTDWKRPLTFSQLYFYYSVTAPYKYQRKRHLESDCLNKKPHISLRDHESRLVGLNKTYDAIKNRNERPNL